jgi:hypothetical protein
MPLDASKAAHIQAVVTRAFQGRQKTVVFVYQAGSVYSYSPIQAIWRSQSIIDPQIPSPVGSQPQPACDMLMIVSIAITMVGVVLVADTSTPNAIAVAAALKYEIIEALPAGIVPGGTHFVVRLRRFR